MRLSDPEKHAQPWLAQVVVASLVGVALAGCGGSSGPKVGDCIDAQKHVVNCKSSAAKQMLVSDLKAPKAIACVVIGPNPQVEVRVQNHPFCAQSK